MLLLITLINHSVSLEGDLIRGFDLIFRFTARDKEILQETITAEQDQTAVLCAVATVILVFVACFFIIVCWKKRWK